MSLAFEVGCHREGTLVGTGSMIPDTERTKNAMMGHMYWGLGTPADSWRSHDSGSEVGQAAHRT